MSDSSVVELMKFLGIPLTREKYLEMNYLGNPPQELCPKRKLNCPPCSNCTK